MPKAIEFSDVELSDGEGARVCLNLTVEVGQCLALVGPLRAGADLILRACVGLIRPERGRAMVLGTEVSSATDDELLALRLRCGAVFLRPGLLSNFTVFNNIALPLRFHGMAREDQIEPMIAARLEAIGLSARRDRFPGELTQGESRSVALIRALIHQPDLLLLEDPGCGLDMDLLGKWLALLGNERRTRPITLVMTAHQPRGLLELADTVVALRAGRVEQIGTPADLRRVESGPTAAYLQ